MALDKTDAANGLVEQTSTALIGRDQDRTADLVARFPALAKHQNYKLGSPRQRIVDALNKVFAENAVPRPPADDMMISRKYLSEQLGVSVSAVRWYLDVIADYETLLPYFGKPDERRFGTKLGHQNQLDEAAIFVVNEFPSVARHQHYSPDTTAGRLVTTLNWNILRNDLQKSKRGKFSQTKAAKNLGISKSAMSSYKEIFDDYNRCIGSWDDKFAPLVPAMDQWLCDRIAERTLEIHDGKINRKQLLTAFGHPHATSLRRFPSLLEFLAKADAHVKEIGYQPSQLAENLKLLADRLADHPPVGKDGFTINRVEIARALGWPYHAAQREPYIGRILEAEVNLRKAIESNPLIVVVERRQFNFHRLCDQGFDDGLVIRIAETFRKAYKTKARAIPKFDALLETMRFVAASESDAAVAVREALKFRLPLRDFDSQWTRVRSEYRDNHIRQKYGNTHRANSKISASNVILRQLGAAGILPPFTGNIKALRVDNQSHLRSVAEVTVGKPARATKPHVDDYVRFATAMLERASAIRDLKITPVEEDDFTASLREELERREYKAAENPAHVILDVIEKRLEALKVAALKIVENAREALEKGGDLLALARGRSSAWRKLGSVNNREYRQDLREMFPTEGADADKGLGSLLHIIMREFGGRVPGGRKDRGGVKNIGKRAMEYGGIKYVQSLLFPSSAAVSACLTLCLLATGYNVDVGRLLYKSCLQPSEEPTSVKFTGYKGRARGKPIYATIAKTSAAVKSMIWLSKAVRRTRKLLGKRLQDLFFISMKRGGFGELSEFIYRTRFKEMVAKTPELEGLNLTPNMIRPSILLRAALTQDGQTALSIGIGQHSQEVNKGYSGKHPTSFLHDANIRHFMHSVETIVIRNVEEIHGELGVSREGFEKRMESLLATGLGVLCSDRHGRPGNGGKICTSLDCWNDCPQLFIVARENDMAILQIWQKSLRAVEGEWMRDRPDRWGEVWLPWLCFADAIELKMRQNYSKVWRAATAIAESIIANPKFQFMRLF